MNLSGILTNGMVLQRNINNTIWGNIGRSLEVRISFLNKNYQAQSDSDGNWNIRLEPLEPGGPHQMILSAAGEETIIQDILIGDVWVLGGQSNMELPVRRTLDLLSAEVERVNHPFIRQFALPVEYNFHTPQDHIVGGNWISASPSDVLDFSAAGFFFAMELYEKYGVPIGLIQTAIGGTPIEAWLSEQTLRHIGGYEAELEQNKDDTYVAATIQKDEDYNLQWYKELGERDLGMQESWFQEGYDADASWKEFELPNSWADSQLESIRGAVWFRKEIDIPASMLEGDAQLILGTIVDADDTYINGTLVGNTGYKYPPRRYTVPNGLLRLGKNTVTVRVISAQNTGEFIKDMPYKLIANKQELCLQGIWKYRIGAIYEAMEHQTFFQYKPSGVYNSMISPLRNYGIKGVIWYQGESNTHQPQGYSNLFRALVQDWRNNWNIGEFPFIFAQLANFGTNDGQAKWAQLREEQRKSLEIANTAMAVAIDIGEYNDIHPQDKMTLGQRFALCAMRIAYEEDIVYSGPIYTSMETIGEKIHLHFDQAGSGLTARNGELNGFELCGTDGVFVPAAATISGDTIIVNHANIKHPAHVRYAWLDNPAGANLYNIEGLPASPFTTS